MFMSTIGATGLTGVYAMFNEQTMAQVFTDARITKYLLCYINNKQAVNANEIQMEVFGSLYDDLEACYEAIAKAQLTEVWIFNGAKGQLIYINKTDFMYIDYAHFEREATPTIEVVACQALSVAGQLKSIVDDCENYFIDHRKQQTPVINVEVCDHCKIALEEATKVKCSRCEQSYYCSRACQGRAIGSHKINCKPLKTS